VTATQYGEAIRAVFAARAQQVLDEYPLAAYASPSLALATVGTDALFSCPARSSERALAASVPTYAFEFSDPHLPLPLRDPVMPLGAPHASELPYLFAVPQATLSPAQRALSDRMIGYWTTFAATGSPDGSAARSWPRYSAASDQVMELRSDGSGPTVAFARDHHCSFWTAWTSTLAVPPE
jgi:para-nitrobenzyl esterase